MDLLLLCPRKGATSNLEGSLSGRRASPRDEKWWRIRDRILRRALRLLRQISAAWNMEDAFGRWRRDPRSGSAYPLEQLGSWPNRNILCQSYWSAKRQNRILRLCHS